MAKKDDYDLDVLLKLRKKERDEAETRYANALAEHKALGKKVQRLEIEHGKMVKTRRRKCQEFDDKLVEGPCDLVKVQNFDHYVAGLRDREEEARDRVEAARREQNRAKREMDRAQNDMREAVRQLKAVQKHYEKWQREQEVVQKRRESAKMDDVAARMWRENRR